MARTKRAHRLDATPAAGPVLRQDTGRMNLTLPEWALAQLQEIADADYLERTDIARVAILTWLRENYPRYARTS